MDRPSSNSELQKRIFYADFEMLLLSQLEGKVRIVIFTRRLCEFPIHGFSSLWASWIYPLLYHIFSFLNLDDGLLQYFDYSDCILGIPVNLIPLPDFILLMKWLNLDNLTSKCGILELILFFHFVSLFVGMYCRFYNRTYWYNRNFVVEHQFKLRTLLISSFGHRSIVHFITCVPAFVYYSPMLYRYLGEELFPAFYLITGAITAFFGMKSRNSYAGCTGIVLSMITILSFTRGPVSIRQDLMAYIILLGMTYQINPGVIMSAALISGWCLINGIVPIKVNKFTDLVDQGPIY